ncbi:MAG: sugar phosphate isomerase/epimerase [Planctomycetes bacterium]|nr:sugar phosphate isomerase/epimerase [Planctomycetota bacterium]
MKPFDIGICSWSMDRHDVTGIFDCARSEFNVGVVQLGFFGAETLDIAGATAIRSAAESAGVEISGTCIGFDGEDYSSIESIRRTGGFGPENCFEDRLAAITKAAALSAELGTDTLVAHIGTVPAESSDEAYSALLKRVAKVADALAHYGVTLLAETGSEPAEVLADFIERSQKHNLAVNLDPANFLLYGTGDPVRAVSALRERIMHVHAKDAVASANPGIDWGTEQPLGTGEANIPRVISKLRAGGYSGPITIECDAGSNRTSRIREGLAYLRSMLERA